MQSIELYTRPGCAYCSAAKNFLQSKSIPFSEYNTAVDTPRLNKMLDEAPKRTFPQISINSQWIGGFDDLLALNLSAELISPASK